MADVRTQQARERILNEAFEAPSPLAYLADRVAALETALGPDAAGRPLPDLLRSAAEVFNYNGDGPLADCLRWKADEIDTALAGDAEPPETPTTKEEA